MNIPTKRTVLRKKELKLHPPAFILPSELGWIFSLDCIQYIKASPSMIYARNTEKPRVPIRPAFIYALYKMLNLRTIFPHWPRSIIRHIKWLNKGVLFCYTRINRLGCLWIEYEYSQTLQDQQRPGWAAWAEEWARLLFPHRACSVCGHGNGTLLWLAAKRLSAPRSKGRSWRMRLLAAESEHGSGWVMGKVAQE